MINVNDAAEPEIKNLVAACVAFLSGLFLGALILFIFTFLMGCGQHNPAPPAPVTQELQMCLIGDTIESWPPCENVEVYSEDGQLLATKLPFEVDGGKTYRMVCVDNTASCKFIPGYDAPITLFTTEK